MFQLQWGENTKVSSLFTTDCILPMQKIDALNDYAGLPDEE